jgi:hypothetical protein
MHARFVLPPKPLSISFFTAQRFNLSGELYLLCMIMWHNVIEFATFEILDYYLCPLEYLEATQCYQWRSLKEKLGRAEPKQTQIIAPKLYISDTTFGSARADHHT